LLTFREKSGFQAARVARALAQGGAGPTDRAPQIRLTPRDPEWVTGDGLGYVVYVLMLTIVVLFAIVQTRLNDWTGQKINRIGKD